MQCKLICYHCIGGIDNIEVFLINSNSSSAEKANFTSKSTSINSIGEIEDRTNASSEGAIAVLDNVIGRISKGCTPIGNTYRLSSTLNEGIVERRSGDLIKLVNGCKES